MLALKLGLSLNNIKAGGGGGGSDITQMLIDFNARITADGGSSQGTSCLALLLTNLNNIS
jgi:hypothetical protein